MVSRAQLKEHTPKLIVLLLVLSLFLVACERPLGGDGGDVPVTVAATEDVNQGGGVDADTAPEVEEVEATELPPTAEPPVEEEEAEEEEGSAIPSTDPDEATAPETEEAAGEEAAAESEETGEAVAEESETAGEEMEEVTEEAAAETTEEDAEAAAEEEAAAAETEETEAAEAPAESAEATGQLPETEQTHVVQAGENLYRIGLQYGVSWLVLADYNNLANPYRIYVGQELKIPPAGWEGEKPEPPVETTTYTVRPGDTLAEIGQAFNVSWPEIAELNNIAYPYRIYVGQQLTIPTGEAPSGDISHTVSRGETVFSISLHYGVPWTTIASANGLEPPYVIYPGQTLVIPGSSQ